MAVSATETETKYDAAGDTVLPALDSLPQVARTTAAGEERLEAEYYDTEDLRLLRAGITLRRRRGGSDAGWHLKLPLGPQTREEIRLPLGPSGRPVPRELAELVAARTRGAALLPMATITTRRQRVSLLDSSGEPLAEMADDRVSAHRQGDVGPAMRWREVEVELAGGGRDLLAAADTLLRQHGLRRSGRSAKLELVLGSGLPPAAAAAPLTPSAPACLVISCYLAAQAEELASLDPMVRRSRPDSVHKMRVATRRLRSTLRSFGAVIRRADTEHLATELKWLGDVLGAARDAEVLAARLRQHRDQADIAGLTGPMQARVESYFANSDTRTAAAVRKALNSARYAALLDELDALIADPPVGPDGNAAAGPALAAAVRRTYRKTRKRMHQALQSPPGPDRDAALHQARKSAKRARYAGEAIAPALGSDPAQFAEQMKRLQTVLGDHQDTVIARQLERRLGMAAHRAGENAFGYGVFYERDACEARLLQDRAAAIWRKVSRRRYRRWLHSGGDG